MPTKPINPNATAKETIEQQNQAAPVEPASPAEPIVNKNAEAMLEEARAYAAKAGVGRRTKLMGSADREAPDFSEYHKIKLKDGRTIVLGPPPTPCDLIIPKMLTDRKDDTNLSIMADHQNATVCCYIRQIDNDVMPQLTKWRECVEIMHRLKELAWRAVNDAYVHYFGSTATYWDEVKN